MRRYNQGFGKVGPMEQCSDGEWVKYEDAMAASNINEAKLFYQLCNEQRDERAQHTRLIDHLAIRIFASVAINIAVFGLAAYMCLTGKM